MFNIEHACLKFVMLMPHAEDGIHFTVTSIVFCTINQGIVFFVDKMFLYVIDHHDKYSLIYICL